MKLLKTMDLFCCLVTNDSQYPFVVFKQPMATNGTNVEIPNVPRIITKIIVLTMLLTVHSHLGTMDIGSHVSDSQILKRSYNTVTGEATKLRRRVQDRGHFLWRSCLRRRSHNGKQRP